MKVQKNPEMRPTPQPAFVLVRFSDRLERLAKRSRMPGGGSLLLSGRLLIRPDDISFSK